MCNEGHMDRAGYRQLHCFGCSENNSSGLQLQFFTDGKRVLETEISRRTYAIIPIFATPPLNPGLQWRILLGCEGSR